MVYHKRFSNGNEMYEYALTHREERKADPFLYQAEGYIGYKKQNLFFMGRKIIANPNRAPPEIGELWDNNEEVRRKAYEHYESDYNKYQIPGLKKMSWEQFDIPWNNWLKINNEEEKQFSLWYDEVRKRNLSPEKHIYDDNVQVDGVNKDYFSYVKALAYVKDTAVHTYMNNELQQIIDKAYRRYVRQTQPNLKLKPASKEKQDSRCPVGYEYVKGYYKKDGTHVKSHCKKKKDADKTYNHTIKIEPEDMPNYWFPFGRIY